MPERRPRESRTASTPNGSAFGGCSSPSAGTSRRRPSSSARSPPARSGSRSPPASSRPPPAIPCTWPGMAATLQATFGPRFVLGLGRGNPGWLAGAGLEMTGYAGAGRLRRHPAAALARRARRLLRARSASSPTSQLEDVDGGVPAPPVWFGTLGQPLGGEDGGRLLRRRAAAPRLHPRGDARRSSPGCAPNANASTATPPASRICQSVITAPDLDDTETRALAHARAVTYLDAPGYGEMLVRAQRLGPRPPGPAARPRAVRRTCRRRSAISASTAPSCWARRRSSPTSGWRSPARSGRSPECVRDPAALPRRRRRRDRHLRQHTEPERRAGRRLARQRLSHSRCSGEGVLRSLTSTMPMPRRPPLSNTPNPSVTKYPSRWVDGLLTSTCGQVNR